MRSFNGTASAIVFWGLGALALTGCVGEVSDPSAGAGAVGEARAADETQTGDPGVPWNPNGASTTGATPTTDQGPVTATPTAPASTCSCSQTSAAPEQGVAPAPEQGVEQPPAQGSAPPQQGAPPIQGGGVAPIGVGLPIGGPILPILPPPLCCCSTFTYLNAYFAGWPLCLLRAP